MKHILNGCVLVSVLMLVACAADINKDGMSPEDLYTIGYRAFQDTDYNKAAEYFDEVEKQHPYSVWSERAQIMAAYAYYRENEYDDALLVLERFIQLHPGNRNTPYAVYLKGLCYFEQMSDAAREQSMTERARDTFAELIVRYPDSVYATDARVKMNEMTGHLAAQEMVIGRYYLQHRDLIPAINRFKNVVENYAETNQAPEAYYRLVTAYYMLGMKRAAHDTADVMARKYTDNPWTKKTLKLVKKEG